MRVLTINEKKVILKAIAERNGHFLPRKFKRMEISPETLSVTEKKHSWYIQCERCGCISDLLHKLTELQDNKCPHSNKA